MMIRTLISLMMLGLVFAGTTARADDVRSAQRDGYGRIVFDWTTPVRYSADVVAGNLVVQFERPITGDLPAVAQSMQAYVNAGRLSADRRTATFPLKAGVTMRTFTVGQAVVVDLLPAAQAQRPAQAPSPAQVPGSAVKPTAITPPPATTRAATPPPAPTGSVIVGTGKTVAVRTGDHGDYFRVAFDWPEKTTYKIERRGDRVAVVGSSRVDLQACKLEYSIVSPK